MRQLWVGLSLALVAGAAHAGDKPVIGPPEAWVKPAEPDKTSPPTDSSALKVLLLDQQLHFTATTEYDYIERRVRVQNAEGLGALGTIVLPWNPDTDTLTIHKVTIIRGDQVIDVLAKQSFTVVRRETNLELASLDGVLTAVIQPEDLRVGDILDLTFTLTRSDPTLKGRAQVVISGLPVLPINRLRIRALWDQPKAIRWRATDGLDGLKLDHLGKTSDLELDVADVQPLHPPDGAPDRYNHARELELSEFSAWSDIAALMRPLYLKAATLAPNSPLLAEVAKIKAASADPKIQAQAALALVQDQVRYVFLGMNDGGLIPADANLTWTRRFGDCKAKTVLLLALLHALGLSAQPALVSTTLGDGLDQRLPELAYFDHVMVRAVIGGKVYWMDGTRTGDVSLDGLRVPGFIWALPVDTPPKGGLERLTPAPLETPDMVTTVQLDASGGLDTPAPAHVETVFRGDSATVIRVKLESVAAADLDRTLKQYWTTSYDFIDPIKTSAVYDARTGEERLAMDGTAKMAWDDLYNSNARRYEADGAVLGWKADFKRQAGPHTDAPFAVNYPEYTEVRESIVLPNLGAGFTVDGDDIDQTIASRAFKRVSKIENGVFSMVASTRSLGAEFPASDAPQATLRLTELSKQDVYVRSSPDYQPTASDLTALGSTEPADAGGYIDRGSKFLARGQFDLAQADFEKALSLDPKSAVAYADRGFVFYDKGDFDRAKADFAQAISLDPRTPAALRGEGGLAVRDHRLPDAISLYSRSLDLDPDSTFALNARAYAYRDTGDFTDALADAAEILRLNPARTDARLFRSDIFRGQGQGDKALAEVDTGIAQGQSVAYLQLYRAGLLDRLGRHADSRKAFDDIIAKSPTVDAYLTRSLYRDKADHAGRMADIDAALKLDPTDTDAVAMRADLLVESGEYDLAAEALTGLLQKEPANFGIQLKRGMAYAKGGHPESAQKDFVAVRALVAKNPYGLNGLCWNQGIVGMNLDGALADCDNAIKLTPQAANILDSRAFVLLRLGRLDEALVGFDAALKIQPKLASSLFARGIVKLRKGMVAEGQADLAAARAIQPDIDAEYARYGVKP